MVYNGMYLFIQVHTVALLGLSLFIEFLLESLHPGVNPMKTFMTGFGTHFLYVPASTSDGNRTKPTYRHET